MSQRWRIALVSFACLLAFGAEAKDDAPGTAELTVDEFSLHVEFPEPMRVLDDRIVPSISIEPARPLSCHWAGDVDLECEVESEEALPLATQIVMTIEPGLYTATGSPLGALRLVADTARPKFMATFGAWKAGVPAIVLKTNAPVAVNEVQRALELRAGDRVWRELSLTALPNDPGSIGSRLALTLPSDLPADTKFELWVRKGLATSVGPLRSEKDDKIVAFRYAEPFRVVGAECAADKGNSEDWNAEDGIALDCVPGEGLRLHFSAPMERSGREALLAKLPAGVRMLDWRNSHERSYRANPTVVQPGETVELRAPQVLSDANFDLDATLRDASGRSLQPIRVAIRNGAPRPSLRARAARMLLAEARGAGVQAVNAGPVEVDVRGFGAGTMRERLTTPDAQARAVMFASEGTRRTLAEGGWVRWQPKGSRPLEIARRNSI